MSIKKFYRRRKPKKGIKSIKDSRPEHLTPQYQTLVRYVKERDKNRCQMPGCKKYRFGIEVHHIIRWNDNIQLRYDPNNCICLCSAHHRVVTNNESVFALLFVQIVKANTLRYYTNNEYKK